MIKYIMTFFITLLIAHIINNNFHIAIETIDDDCTLATLIVDDNPSASRKSQVIKLSTGKDTTMDNNNKELDLQLTGTISQFKSQIYDREEQAKILLPLLETNTPIQKVKNIYKI